jgi:hypothetical protein
MGTLTSIGLAFDLVGAVILLGPEYGPVEKLLKKIDPLYRSIIYGINTLYAEAVEENEDGNRATTGKMAARRWEFTIARWFLNRRIEERIRKDDMMNLSGVAVEKNGERLHHTDVDHPDKKRDILGTRDISQWIEESQERRMYRLGGSLLVLGFGLQLLAQLL